MSYKDVDPVDSIQECMSLISKITGIENRFFLTNISISLLTIAFNHYKEFYPTEIRILIAYKPCISTLKNIYQSLNNTKIDYKVLIERFRILTVIQNKEHHD